MHTIYPFWVMEPLRVRVFLLGLFAVVFVEV
jgi:hypothetical protein